MSPLSLILFPFILSSPIKQHSFISPSFPYLAVFFVHFFFARFFGGSSFFIAFLLESPFSVISAVERISKRLC